MNISEIKNFLQNMFPNVPIEKILSYGNNITIYFSGFNGEICHAIRKVIMFMLKTQLNKQFPGFYFHVSHVIINEV